MKNIAIFNNPKLKNFINKWGGWIGVALALLYIIYISANGSDFERGFNEGAKGKTHFKQHYRIVVYATFIIILALIAAFAACIGWVHYNLLHKPIFKKGGISYIIFYILLSIAVYDALGVLFEKIPNMKKDNAEAISIAFWIFGMMFSIVADFLKNKKEQAKLLQEKTKAELGALKAQVNPHFLFNTLNNLYGTAIVEDSPKTAAGIQQLSGIMRHVVEESKNDKTPIEKEIKFLGDYIELQEVRLPKRENIKIHTKINWDEKPTMITPLLLIPFLENAFKYGISITQECFIEMSLSIDNQQLMFDCCNSIIPNNHLEESTGTGIENVRKRLELLYPNAHKLEIEEKENVFSVKLALNLASKRE